MELFRISLKQFAKSLTASGYSNRWNRRGQNVIYTASSRSLAALEMITRSKDLIEQHEFKMMVIFVPDNENLFEQVLVKSLPQDWRKPKAYSILQEIGSKWITDQRSLLFKIPSALIPQEYSYVINIAHPDFKKNVKLVRVEDYLWDERLV